MAATDLRTPTDVLISAMEDIGNAEDLLIVWREKNADGKGGMNWRTSAMPLWRALGIIEAAKVDIVRATIGDDEE